MKLDLNVASSIKTLIGKGAVVGLESTILAHGFAAPTNRELADALEAAVREGDATPATIAVRDGQAMIGLDGQKLDEVCGGSYAKTNIADMGIYLARKQRAATTVSATISLGAQAGIRWFATGGIGGVHRGDSGDVSSDIFALANTPVALVCSGAKTFLDLRRTYEALESNGIAVVGYKCDEFPGFYYADTGIELPHRVDDLDIIVAIAKAQRAQGRGLLVVNPVPKEHDLGRHAVESLIESLLEDGPTGKAASPYALAQLAQSPALVRANRALALANARLAGLLAAAEAAQ